MKAKVSLRVFFFLSAYSENAWNVFKPTIENARNVFKRIWRIRANVELFAEHRIVSEYAERIYAYMEKTQRDSWHIKRIRQVK